MNGLLLGLDCCGTETTLALAELDGSGLRVLREARLPARSAGARLTGALAELLGDQRPGGIVVVRGPGSFTGMRIGLSAAKALSEALPAPILGVSRLQVLAGMAGQESAALDAGRGGVYLRENGSERLLPAEEMSAGLGGQPAIAEESLLRVFPQSRLLPSPTAADALRFGLPRALRGEWDEAAELDALYLWRTEQMFRAPA